MTTKSLPFLLRVKRGLFFWMRKLTKLNSHKLYYSQTGEDVILEYLLPQKKGFYVDVGCYYPVGLSNTFNFYLKGWRGINIDASPEVCKEFAATRLRDIVVNAAVSEEVKEVNYYVFGETGGVNTIEETQVETWKEYWDLSEVVKMQSRTLDGILEEHLPKNQEIDLLSIDVEGHEMSVLKSINFTKHRPKVIVMEIHEFDIMNPKESEYVKFMDIRGYDLKFYATINAYFTDRNWKSNR